jgi:hypothetical protein
MSIERFHPIGTPGVPWGAAERAEWLASQPRRRSHAVEVDAVILSMADRHDVIDYGQLEYPPDRYVLRAVASRGWDAARPLALVTGGVHGYETSGVHGALEFLAQHADRYAGKVDLLVVPCVSPWAYERIHRWNAEAVDPNRSFREPSPSAEAAALMRLVAPHAHRIVLHVDLHETTDSDETEFRPSLAARDGKPHEPGLIPDGFYVVGDAANPQLEFQQAVIAAVAQVTHIAPADAAGCIIGSPVVAPGVILYPLRPLGLCAGMTDARYSTTTEVYPDSPRSSPATCNHAQAIAVCAALDYVLSAAGSGNV